MSGRTCQCRRVVRVRVRGHCPWHQGLALAEGEAASERSRDGATGRARRRGRVVVDVGLAGVVGQSVVGAGVAGVGVLVAGRGSLERGRGDSAPAVSREEVVWHAVAVEVGARAVVQRERIVRVGRAVVVVVIISVVAGSITVGVVPLGIVEREGVDVIVCTVVVVVAVQHQSAGAARCYGVRPAVAVSVGVSAAVQRERISHVGGAVSVVVGVGVVTGSITVGVDPLVDVIWEVVHGVGVAVTVAVCVQSVAGQVAVHVGRCA